MAVGINPYQLAQLWTQPQKERASVDIEERGNIGFEKQYKKKMSDELQSILEKLQKDAKRRQDKHKGFRKFLDVASLFDPTGLVKGGSSYLGAKDMKESLKLMNASQSTKNKYRGSFLSQGLTDYNKDINKAWRGINTGKAFGMGTLMDFAGKKIGADGGSNRMKFSDFGDVASSFKTGFQSSKDTGSGFFKNIWEGGKKTATGDTKLIEGGDSTYEKAGTFKESPLGKLVGKYGGAEATQEGEKKLALLLNQLLGGDEYNLSGDYRDYFGQNTF
tara:strand:+ start:78 stop:902 length:825 start_codon:yes stop_codon:yes gene_type:complete